MTEALVTLSAREVEVVQYVSFGYTNAEIGAVLDLSPLTIKAHLARIADKVGTGDRAGIVGACFRAGVLTVDAQDVSEYGHQP